MSGDVLVLGAASKGKIKGPGPSAPRSLMVLKKRRDQVLGTGPGILSSMSHIRALSGTFNPGVSDGDR